MKNKIKIIALFISMLIFATLAVSCDGDKDKTVITLDKSQIEKIKLEE